MSPIPLRDRLSMNQVLKFQINSLGDKKIIDYAISNHGEGILYFSSKLNQSDREKVRDYIENNHQGYEFCNMGVIGCLELGFSKLNSEENK